MTLSGADLSPAVRSDLLAAVRLVGVVNGRTVVDGVPIGSAPVTTEDSARLQPGLAGALYSRWFAGWWPPSGWTPQDVDEPQIIAKVRAAHAGTERFQPGWVARGAVPGGGVVAVRDEEELYLLSGDYANLSRLAAPVRAGDWLAVTTRRDAAEPQDGWWLTWGAAGPAPDDRMIRIYWNCGPAEVSALVRGLTTVLEDRAVPYTLKCPAEASLFGRRDGVVLYLGPDVWALVKGDLKDVHQGIADRLSAPTPPMTLMLGRGVSLAEDPGNGHSFGETMAWAVADGVLAALTAGIVDVERVLDTLAARLAANGVSPVRPFQRADSPADEVSAW